MTTGVLASRVMRARRSSTCPVCRNPIRVGDQIAKSGTWQHIEHVIERNHPASRREVDQMMRERVGLAPLPAIVPLHKMAPSLLFERR